MSSAASDPFELFATVAGPIDEDTSTTGGGA